MSETKKLADFAANLSFDDIPKDVVERIKFLVMDTVGISIRAMHDAESTPALLSASQAMGYLGGQSRVMGSSATYTPPAAAMINGTLAHSLDFDDTHAAGSLHTSAPIIPAAFAAAEMTGAGGSDVITAITAGFEVQIRLSLALNPTEHYKRGYHPSATCGTFGAAAAAGSIFKLDSENMESAFGIAECQTSGSMRFLADGAWTKRFQVGYAGHNGLIAACLAREGFKGPIGSVEGKDGFLQSYAPNPDLGKAAQNLGKVWETMNIAVKPYPSCRYSHAAIDGIIDLKKELDFSIDDLDDIDIGLSETALNIIGYPLEDKQNPKSIVDGQFSMPFCAAVAVKSGGLKWDDYKDHLNNNETLALCNKVKVTPDKDAENCCPEFMSAKVRMVVKGKTYEKFVKIPKGEPENFMKDEEFISKFKGLTEPYLSNDRVNQLTDLMLKIDQANNVNSIFEYSQIDL